MHAARRSLVEVVVPLICPTCISNAMVPSAMVYFTVDTGSELQGPKPHDTVAEV